jgi:hypothetical protein
MEETAPLMGSGSGEVALQDSNSKHAEEAKQDYGAVDEEKEEVKEKAEPEWHDEEAPAAWKKKKKGKTIQKSIRISESIHEVLINRPHRPFCLLVFHFIQAVAILASLSLLITQVLPLLYLEQGFKQIGLLQIALRYETTRNTTVHVSQCAGRNYFCAHTVLFTIQTRTEFTWDAFV